MDKTTHILRTKLHEPPVRGDHVYRNRLIDKLNDNYQKNALILVSAPAGYGKSYLVSCWLTENKIPFGWVSLNEEDNDLRTFLLYFTASVEKVYPGILQKTVVLLKSAELPPLSVVTNTLINELDGLEQDFVLVLDDYHFIKEKQIHNLINAILQYPPENMLLCIITRIDPPLKIGSLRAYNRLNEIRMEDLAFTLQEVPILYKNMISLEIGEELSKKLLMRTEGWVTGLRLTALSVKSKQQLENILKKMKHDSLLITDYLFEEVLIMQPEEYQKYLLKTSLLDRFCADLVEVLDVTKGKKNGDGTNGEEFIKWLESTNLFVIPLDNEHKWFRYHHLFRELLLKQLKKKRTIEQINKILKVASAWFEKNNLIEEAIKYMLEANELECAAGIVEKHSTTLMNFDQWQILDGWLRMLPAKIINQRVKLQIAVAWVSRVKFNMDEIYTALERYRQLLGKDFEENISYGEWCSLMGFVKSFREGDISGSLHFLKKAMKLIPAKSEGLLRAETELHLALTGHMSGKSDEYLNKIKARLAKHQKRGRFWERLQFGLSTIHILKGDLQLAYDDAILLKEYTKQNANEFVEGWSRWFLGVIAFHRFELEDALHHFNRITQLCYIMNHRASIDGLIGHVITYQLLGQPDKANERQIDALEFAEWSKDPFHMALLNSEQAHIALLRGNISEAIKWQRTLKLEPHFPSMAMYLCNPFITECRVLLAESTNTSLKQASKKLEKLYEGTKTFNYICQTIDILVLQSILQQKIGHIKKAVKIMEKVMEIAIPGGWIRPFIEAGSDVINILNQLIKQNIHVEYCRKLVRIFNNYEKELFTNVPLPQVSGISPTESLSERELEILSLLSHGLKNREIGDKIFLAPTTIKKHIYNIFQKLNAHTRIEAISRAHDLGLISK